MMAAGGPLLVYRLRLPKQPFSSAKTVQASDKCTSRRNSLYL